MRTSLVWKAIVEIILLAGTSVSARVCVLATEPDESVGRVRFVLPPGDPCSCTQVMLGGHNTYAPPRKDRPVYIDIQPKEIEGPRRSQGCPEIRTNEVTSEAPTTTEIPVTSAVPTTTEIPVYTDCQAVLDSGQVTDGVYNILIAGTSTQAFCDLQPGSPGKGFIVIQKRTNGSVSFDRTWAEYRDGFGEPGRDFWWGNSKLQTLTDNEAAPWELVVDLEAFDGSSASEHYDDFSITGSTYDLTVDGFEGDAGDGLNSNQLAFTTTDQDNDNSGGLNCAEQFYGGWWYDKCKKIDSNLNGKYSVSENVEEYQGLQWVPWRGEKVSLKGCQMKIRRILE